MNSRIKKLAVVVTVLAVSLLVFAGASLAQGGTPPTTTPDSAVTTPLQQMQEWMGADAWGQMIQRMTEVHGAEATGQMLQQMNSGTGTMGSSMIGTHGGGMMGGGFHTSGSGFWSNMMSGFQGMMDGYGR